MAKIKYAVVGIDPQSLNNLVGTLARGEVEGPADTVVLPAPVPAVYQYTNEYGRMQIKETSFTGWLERNVAKEIRRLNSESAGEKIIGEVVEQLSTEKE